MRWAIVLVVWGLAGSAAAQAFTEAEADADAETEAVAETETEADADADADAEAESASVAGSEAESDSGAESVAGPGSDAASETESASIDGTSDSAGLGALDPCGTDLRSRPVGPLQVGIEDGNLGVAHRVCPRDEVAIGGDLLLVAHSAELYGNLRVGGRVRAAARLFDPNVEMYLSWEPVRYQTILGAVSAAYLGHGYLGWGLSAMVLNEGGRALAVTGRFVAPTTSGLDRGAQPVSLDLGLTAAYQASAHFRFHAWLGALGTLYLGGPAAARAGLRVGGGADWRPYEWISFVLEISSGFGYRDGLDHLAASAGLRFALGTELGLELGATMPVLGQRAYDDGALPIAASLMLAWRLR
ncbi:MAG: hypothetical protein VYE22_19875 [Myxococcota bacterium]|nr:hypothetical protein [Myxococcota bacterium]